MPLMERNLQNLRVLMRAQSITAEIRLRHILSRTALLLLSGLIACFGLLMLDVAAFFALETGYGAVRAALYVGAANIGLAVLLVFLASLVRPDRELELARDVQDMALNSVIKDMKGLFQNPFDSVLGGAASQVLGILIQQLRRSKGE